MGWRQLQCLFRGHKKRAYLGLGLRCDRCLSFWIHDGLDLRDRERILANIRSTGRVVEIPPAGAGDFVTGDDGCSFQGYVLPYRRK